MKCPKACLPVLVLVGMLVQSGAAGEQSSPGYNILPNAGFMKVRSGYWPDWWNWYNALGNKNINLQECWQLVDEHHVPGTRSVRLTNGARVQTSYLRVYFQKDTTFALSAWLRSERPDTKVEMYIGGWDPINEVKEVTVGTEWKRYHVTGTTTSKKAKPLVIIGLLGNGPLWVNAPQLEEGSAPTKWKLSLRDAPGEPDAEGSPEPKFAIPKIDCLKIDKAPVIDGVLDDAAWQEASAAAPFMRLDESTSARQQTDVYVCRDDEAIYVAFRCHEPEMDRLTTRQTLYDAVGIFQDDCVEVFISGNEDGSEYLRFASNARGTKLDSKGFTKFFDTEWTCATGKGEDFWSIEFRLPLSSLERPLQPGSPWRINFCRFRARPKEEEHSAWAPVVRTFHDPQHFGFIYGIIAQVSRRTTEEAPAGTLVAYLDRSFYTTEDKAGLYVDAPAGTAVQITLKGAGREETLSSSGLAQIDLSALAPGEYPIEVAVDNRRAGLVLKKLSPKANAVKIDRVHRIFMVDDKPFVPFAVSGHAKHLKQQADLDFTCTYAVFHRAFDDEGQKRLRELLDTAESLKMKVIVWYSNHEFIDDHAGWERELLEIVETFKDHPAVLAWWVFDEPVSNIKWLKGLCESVNKADPYHPVFVNWCDRGHGWTTDMGDVTGDVNCLDGYYINAYDYTPNQAFEMIGGHCTEMTADARKRGNVVAYINGIHGWATAIREPSPEENRFVTYVSLIRGARMLLYYNWGPPANPALTESFRPLAGEMQTLAPIVANPEVKEKVSCDNERIDYTAFQAKDGLYIIALNTDENDETATVRVQGAEGQALVLFEDRRRGIEGGSFQDTFKPIERHVYRIAGAARK